LAAAGLGERLGRSVRSCWSSNPPYIETAAIDGLMPE
jgi:hypothetical protein